MFFVVLLQKGSVLKSAHSRPSVTPVGGAVSPATARAWAVVERGPRTVSCVRGGLLRCTGSVPWSTAPSDSTLTVRIEYHFGLVLTVNKKRVSLSIELKSDELLVWRFNNLVFLILLKVHLIVEDVVVYS